MTARQQSDALAAAIIVLAGLLIVLLHELLFGACFLAFGLGWLGWNEYQDRRGA